MDNLNQLMNAQRANLNYEKHPLEDQMFTEYFGKTPPVIAIFYIGATRDGNKSTPECPVWMDTVMVYLKSTESLNRDSATYIAEEEHIQRYPNEWQAFLKNREKHLIPLESLPKFSPAIKAAMNELGVKSIDDLLAKDALPEYLLDYKKWAGWIKSCHNSAEGKPKLKVVA